MLEDNSNENSIEVVSIPNDYQLSNKTSSCFNIEYELLELCTEELINYQECCSVRHGYCERTQLDNCKIDSCACIAFEMESNNINTLTQLRNNPNIIGTCVSNTLNSLLNFTCNLPQNNFIVPIDTLPDNTPETAFCNALIQEATFNARAQCNEGNSKNKSGVYIMIGLLIGLIVSLLIFVVVYVVYLKPKINSNIPYNVINDNTTDTDITTDG